MEKDDLAERAFPDDVRVTVTEHRLQLTNCTHAQRDVELGLLSIKTQTTIIREQLIKGTSFSSF